MIVDGRAISKEILEEVLIGRTRPVIVRAITVRPTPSTLSYLHIKERAAKAAGMTLELVQLPPNASTEEVIKAIQAPGADAVIVQLPLPETLDEERIRNAIPIYMDADVLSDAARLKFMNGEEGALMPPVACAVAEILTRSNIAIAGSKAVVVGYGDLVGKPVATYLKNQGADVTILEEHIFEEGRDALGNASILVSGAGVPHLITADMVQDGVVLIDAGTSEMKGAIAGDIDPAAAHKASVFTPVPGGVGPITVACLFRNVLQLSKHI